MRITEKILKTKIENYNRISDVKLKLNNDVAVGVNLYTENNNLVASGKVSQIDLVLDALITVKRLEIK